MACQRCKSDRVLDVGAKCSDCCGVSLHNSEHEGYVPKGIGIGGGDMIHLSYCLDCGQIQGQFPISKEMVEENEEWDHCTEDA